jgi:hypothetical protein
MIVEFDWAPSRRIVDIVGFGGFREADDFLSRIFRARAAAIYSSKF